MSPVELETDKVNVEVPSPIMGFWEVSSKRGREINVGSILGRLKIYHLVIK